MKINKKVCPFPLSHGFTSILETEIDKHDITEGKAVILNFRDPTYSADEGGFHPVEIRVSAFGGLVYVTDFAYVGLPPHAELAKEIDFDFGCRIFEHFGREHPIEVGGELFTIWRENFVSYYQMGVFEVTVQVEE